mmetsp:Transcript_31387/g.69586  ORF Transcript_31387/g.69586 Transcript_31387/m.69586 type:complete len:254 (+) Transcript_31387:180-941(+)
MLLSFPLILELFHFSLSLFSLFSRNRNIKVVSKTNLEDYQVDATLARFVVWFSILVALQFLHVGFVEQIPPLWVVFEPTAKVVFPGFILQLTVKALKRLLDFPFRLVVHIVPSRHSFGPCNDVQFSFRVSTYPGDLEKDHELRDFHLGLENRSRVMAILDGDRSKSLFFLTEDLLFFLQTNVQLVNPDLALAHALQNRDFRFGLVNPILALAHALLKRHFLTHQAIPSLLISLDDARLEIECIFYRHLVDFGR